MDDEERQAMEFFIACAPEDHPAIPGAGGFRKARWGRLSAGAKRKAARGLLTPLLRVPQALIDGA